MQIECLIKRIGGTEVRLRGKKYHFKPVTGIHEDPHVCEITNRDVITRLLQIDAYAVVLPEDDSDDDGDDEAFDALTPGGEAPEPTAQDPADDFDAPPVEGDAPVYENMGEAALIEAYAKEFGRAPHPSSKPETLRAKLIAKRDGTEE